MIKSILTFVDAVAGDDAPTAERLAFAAEIARRRGGHLTVLAVGYEPDMPAYSLSEIGTGVTIELYKAAQEAASAAAAAASEFLSRDGALHDVRPLVSPPSMISGRFGALARFADLVVLDQPYAAKDEPDLPAAWPELLEGALFDADAAVLLRPGPNAGAAAAAPRFERIVVAWNESREALRAARCAQPLLSAAQSVEIVVVDPPRSEQELCADLAVMLSRHGAEISVTPLASAGRSISETLRQHVVDFSADLLVMGAYGQSRFREYMLGGPTREILQGAPTATLMAH